MNKIYKVEFVTSRGNFIVEIDPSLSPLGADRFLELVKDRFFNDTPIYRIVPAFLMQFGISLDDSKKHWHNKTIIDDSNVNVKVSKYSLCFAGCGPDTRTTNLFIAFRTLNWLGNSPWETPFGKVIEGTEIIDQFQSSSHQLDQVQLKNNSEEYINDNDLHNIDKIISVSII
jgi:cyclophilin family peptidyl-prolyl cis-trans isomerase